MVDYKLRKEITALIVCLYDPKSEIPFSTEKLSNYVDDCCWQLENGELPRRIAFHIAPAPADAKRAIDDMTRTLQALRKEEQQESQANKSPSRFRFKF